MTSSVSTPATRQIARAAGTVMAAFVLSNAVGLVRQLLVTQAFGTSSDMDAFYAANQIPSLIYSLIAGGALASSFIPTFSGLLAREDRSGAWKLASAILNIVTLVLFTASLLAEVFAPQVVSLLYSLKPDLDTALKELTVSLLRVLLISPVIFGASGLLMGILNTHQKFLLPALASSMLWVGMIIGIILFVPRWGIYGLAWGAVLGAMLHLVIQLPDLLRLKVKHYFPTLGLHLPAVREVARLMGPRLLGVAVVQINFVVNTILATAQSEGSLTAINTAWMVVTMPQAVIAQAIAIASLPTFSALVARGHIPEMRSTLAATLRGVIFLSLPASLGLILLRKPVITLLFQRGAFTAESTELVAWALLWYAAGLVGHSLVEILARAFYAQHDTRTPVFVGAVVMGLNVVFSVAFSALFARLGWMPHGGLALANSLATALEATGLLVLMRRRLGGLDGMNTLCGVLQAIGAALAMCLGIGLWLRYTGDRSVLLVSVGGVALGGAIYIAALLALGVREARGIVIEVVRRGGMLRKATADGRKNHGSSR
jgi:putative peptidoglycan lipid II flippase